MNAENDQREQVLNRKCSKRNFEKLKSFDSVELLSNLPATSSNKRSKVFHSVEKSEDNFLHESCHFDLCQRGKRKLEENPHEIAKEKKKKKFTEIEKSYYSFVSDNNEGAISNCLNEFASEEPNQKKQSAYELHKNEEDITPTHTAIPNDELSKGRELSQLAIIPFEGEYANSAFNCKYERSNCSSHGNLHIGSTARDRNDVKNIFHLLSKKDIFYKNLIKNKIKSNKPLMIKCDNLSFFLNRNNCGGNSSPNEFVSNVKTAHFANDVMPSSTIFDDTNGEQNLHHMNEEESVPLFFGSLNEDSPTTNIRSNNAVPILSTPNNAQADMDKPFDCTIPNMNVNMSENAVTNISPYPSSYSPDILNPNDGNYFASEQIAQNNEARLYNQHDCTNYYIPEQIDNFNTAIMSKNQNNSETIGHVNSLSDVGNYYQANDYNAYQ
ncbi:Uncharacterized protein PCOAH_00041450 [Plasmodium coatneyi]|uniref:Uncharacterized protein n=1 Tax=Plasmodium coatneyi TaxID=208452 RepID=A0A1B1E3S1_9APIC|nr:Uncharacterized protein PCOAH_00041450 [Plasmodium coatneyi]ANQ09663.1 Uncharacterized protein PCOAH_00041450 [Plasmodium coatneyi]